MNIALDYDGTYTLDEPFWNEFVYRAIEDGHEVSMVTMRYNNEDERVEPPHDIQIIYTERKAKRQAMDRLGIKIDVWIDDRPEWIFTDG